jgi:nucleotide-binding universal stress UspA family protein
MQGKILVAMQGQDRPEEIIPYLENLARPGMRVIFLLRYPVKLWSYLRDHWIDTESPRKAQAAGRELAERYSREAEIELAEEKIAPARDALREKPISVEVELYTGNLKSKVLEHTAKGDVDWIIMPAPRRSWPLRLLAPATARSGALQWAKSLPVMLLSPKFLAERQARFQSVAL